MSSSWSCHWHGFGPWTGTQAEYNNEAPRRPGRDLSDERTRIFLTSTVPPVQTGHALLRRELTSVSRTWADPDEAVEWLVKTYSKHPPIEVADGGGRAYCDLDVWVRGADEALRLGSDTSWAYYVPGYSYVSYQVICCLNRFFPSIPCPRPPV